VSVRIEDAHAGPRLDEARRLILEFVEWLGVDMGYQDFAAEMAALPGKYQPPQGALRVALVDGRAVGVGGLRPLEEGIAELKRVFVSPQAQGRGAGTRLVEALLDDARRLGYRRVRLDTLDRLRAANALYERLGFVDIPPYCENPYAGARFMELAL
jgi:GNAT superfamily N-acetyltransferase